jgi:hypothetical protein
MISDFHKTEIIIVNSKIEDKSTSKELAEDIISIMHYFRINFMDFVKTERRYMYRT